VSRSYLLVAVHLAALWPVATWYVTRTTQGGGEHWGLAAAAAAVVIAARSRPAEPLQAPRLGLPIALLAVYALAFAFVPPLVRAALGVTSLAAIVSEVRFGRRMVPALALLLLLALPDVSTLQFFVGWPMRVAVGAVAAPALSAVGIDAAREGTWLVVEGRAVVVDAPCSGVWLAWGASVLWLALALARSLTARATFAGLALLVPLVFAANVARTVALVLVETRPALPAWSHEAVGLVVLAAAAVAVVLLSERYARCAPRRST
jgi:exosortase/archaeosortase family protein